MSVFERCLHPIRTDPEAVAAQAIATTRKGASVVRCGMYPAPDTSGPGGDRRAPTKYHTDFISVRAEVGTHKRSAAPTLLPPLAGSSGAQGAHNSLRHPHPCLGGAVIELYPKLLGNDGEGEALTNVVAVPDALDVEAS